MNAAPGAFSGAPYKTTELREGTLREGMRTQREVGGRKEEKGRKTRGSAQENEDPAAQVGWEQKS